MRKENERSLFIDVAKGLGILMVMCGHVLSKDQGLCPFLYVIHIPLFSILSGFFEKKQDNFVRYVCKTFKRLYIPFVTITCIDYLVYFFTYAKGTDDPVAIWFYLALFGSEIVFNIPIWYLFVLFVIKVASQLFHLIKKEMVKKMVMITVITFGFLYMHSFDSFPVKNRFVAIFSIVPVLTYYCIGYLSKNIIDCISNCFKKKTVRRKILMVIIMIVSLSVTAVLSQINGFAEVFGCMFGKTPLFIISSISGAFGIMILSSVIASSKKCRPRLLSYFGRHSLAVQVTHFYITEYLTMYILEKTGKEHLRFKPLSELAIMFETVIICLIFILLTDLFRRKIRRLSDPA
ncbi:MAG: acyltransferase [Clostridiales bacterium]|nr:acyltransferase [Clostridiales bacterium]